MRSAESRLTQRFALNGSSVWKPGSGSTSSLPGIFITSGTRPAPKEIAKIKKLPRRTKA